MDISHPVKRFTHRMLRKGGKTTWASLSETDSAIGTQLTMLSSPASSQSNETSFAADPPQTASHLGAKVISRDSNVQVEFDIWFVHGLMGNPSKTWTHENGTFWPTLLADDFPQARVIMYGYDADVVKFAGMWQNASSEGLQSYGQSLAFAIRNSRRGHEAVPAIRPIYFIGHSLGGLVIEQSLLICIGPDQSLHEIATATAGIMFMGTPHEGSHLARWGSTFAKIIPDHIRYTNTKILKALHRESDTCKNVEESFQTEAKHGRFRSIRLFCFYETIVMPGLSTMIVSEESAALRADFKCPIHGTHTSMVRFAGPDDDGYLKVKGQLTSWIWAPQPKLNSAATATAPATATTAKPAAERKERAKRKRPRMTSIRVVGPQFAGVEGGTIHADQYTTGSNMHIQYGANSRQNYYYGSRKRDTKNGGSGGEGEEAYEDESGC